MTEALCPGCGKTIKLTKAGVFRYHGHHNGGDVRCGWSGQRPREDFKNSHEGELTAYRLSLVKGKTPSLREEADDIMWQYHARYDAPMQRSAAVQEMLGLIDRERKTYALGFLQDIQQYSDPSHQRVSPYQRLKMVDSTINKVIAAIEEGNPNEECE